MKNPATQAPILTKPNSESFKRWKSDQTCGFSLPLQWKKEATMQNPATQAPILTKPRRRKLQAMEIRSDVWFLATTPVEEKSTLEWRVGLICFGFDLFMGFWGLEVESGTTFGESKKRKGRTRSSIAEAKLTQVLWTWFLDVWTRVRLTRVLCLRGQISPSVAAWCWNQVQ